MNTTDGHEQEAERAEPHVRRSVGVMIPLAIVCAVALVALSGQVLLARAAAQRNHVALASSAKPVSVAAVEADSFRPTRRYVAARSISGSYSLRVGPQFVSAYVSTVLVRPGAPVRRGEVLATLDCRQTDAVSREVSQQARALESMQGALSRQASREAGLLPNGLIAANDVDQRQAESSSEQARLLAARAQLAGTSLAVSDCVLRAPFDGEIGERMVDPGAFVRPGTAIVSEVDRTVLRVVADVPETDFTFVGPNTPVRIHVLSTSRDVVGTVTRRSPSADAATRTVHIEIDLPDPLREIPVNTTAETDDRCRTCRRAATQIPLIAA